MKKTTKKRSDDTKGNFSWRTTLRNTAWITGLITVLVGIFSFIAVLASFFCLKNDIALLQTVPTDNPTITPELSNPFGPLGAKVGWLLVTRSFGLCGVFVPVIIMLLGSAMLTRYSRRLNHIIMSLALVTIVGAMTLGLAFGTNWDMFGSGLGGRYGIALSDFMTGYIGFGAWFVIFVAWILTGIFVNANFIEYLNRKCAQLFDKTKAYVAHLREVRAARAAALAAEEEARAVEEDEQTPEEVVQAPEENEQDTNTAGNDIDDVPVVGEPVVEEVSEEDTENITEDTAEKDSAEENVADESDEADDDINRRPFNPDSTPLYEFPSEEYLRDYQSKTAVPASEIEMCQKQIEETLNYFGIPVVKIIATAGPTVTLYEIVQEKGVKIARVQGLENDIAQALKATAIRIIAPMPGRGTIGIEVPNRTQAIVSMRSAIQSEAFRELDAELPVVIGRTIYDNYVFDLAKMPHLLVAGSTGQGKSVGLNAIITSLLYRKDPMQLKFVLIDPKTVEFNLYAPLEHHFLAKMESEEAAIVTDPQKALYTLHSLCNEMETRLRKCAAVQARNIKEYNDKVRNHEIEATDIMPYIVVIIDEFADLIMAEKSVEKPVMRLAQKARAIGIHLIVATQRPDVKVITGTIKANFPARIAFRVMQMIDSRTIIDQPGANQLVGRGDMLLSKDGMLTRIQCAYVDTPEVVNIVNHIATQPAPLNGCYMLGDYIESGDSGDGGNGGGVNYGGSYGQTSFSGDDEMGSVGGSGVAMRYDKLFADIARDAVMSGEISVSHMQRCYAVGFNRAGRIMTELERAGIVGKKQGVQKREVKFHDLPSLEAHLQSLGVI